LQEKLITLEEITPQSVYGHNDKYLNLIKDIYPEIKLVARGNQLKLLGEPEQVTRLEQQFRMYIDVVKRKIPIDEFYLKEIFDHHQGIDKKTTNDAPENKGNSKKGLHVIMYGHQAKPIVAKTKNQKGMVDSVVDNDILFAVGPAGSGKTYTAVAIAVSALKNKEVKKIILSRPAVEAGENLGFLPGDLKEKIDPYLRPLYDALEDMIAPDKLKVFLENRTIEIAPMAFMRGRTLDNCFVILDEAQNSTELQLKMFLTRMGVNAKVIVTGDLTQVDLPVKQKSGLHKAINILHKIKGIKIIELTHEDVVRHRLVVEILKAYDQNQDK
jgi:phosphate starvation-inducible protein PhoH and related proteins